MPLGNIVEAFTELPWKLQIPIIVALVPTVALGVAVGSVSVTIGLPLLVLAGLYFYQN